ncbi:DUF4856 domain-containing protein [Saccharobesus litoralis]|uniref:DUF4856 domain-containing protein n=1 Tax=Saccharobesus litoralis TaxID=2172099 RepID=A0A2S0VSZ7_9ALTE|nr:DUF4856 domain-containing protein [Saccharobesus litoralis]AWB67327.1 DUF4856 domain-containing protein [Saccharobesus litoralis]
MAIAKSFKKNSLTVLVSSILAVSLSACGGSDSDDNGANQEPKLQVPATYTFESQLTTGSSVSYTGQIARHALIQELTNFVGSLDAGNYTSNDEVVAALNEYFRDGDDTASDKALTLTTTPGTEQTTVRDISDGKNLIGKIAGKDATGQHKDWETAGNFKGWMGINTPTDLVDHFFDLLAAEVVDINGNSLNRQDPEGNALKYTYVTSTGLDLKQLIQKFLLGAVAFSQGADDYLDSDTAGKGLLSANQQVDGKSYTALEHQIDEGFGYFGAARDYAEYSDLELAGKDESANARSHYFDTNTDGKIDLNSEYNWGNSVNAGKRDNGATVATDLTKDAFDAFLTLRALANEAAKNPSSDDAPQADAETVAAMKIQAEAALLAWEKSISASVIHYINYTIADLKTIKAGGYTADEFADLAKHWSEMKGFALGLQFNRLSPVSDADFEDVLSKMQDAPVLDTTKIDDYIADLESARTILGNAYSFNATNVAEW